MSGQRFVPAIALRRSGRRMPRRLADLSRGPMGNVRRSAMARRRRPQPLDLAPTATGTRRELGR